MCSDAAGTRRALTLALVMLVTGFGCGHKEDPKPPPQKIPAPILDLLVTQRGNELRVSFTYPQVTISGTPIEDVAAIEIWEYEVAVPEFVVPGAADEDEDEEGGDDEGGEGEDAEGEPDSEGAEPEPGQATGETETPMPAELEPIADESGDEAESGDDEEEGAGADENEGDDLEAAGEDQETGEDSGDDAEAEDAEDDDEPDLPPAPVIAKETLLEIDPREFFGASRLRLKLEGEELSSAIRGDKVQVTLTLDEIEPGEKTALVFGVKSFQSLKRSSAFSNLVTLIPRVTPEPPADLELEPVKNGVLLKWTFEGEDPIEFRFYRRDELSPLFDQHFGFQTGDGDRFLDASAEIGNTYEYAMTVVTNSLPLVESSLSPIREIEYLDTFPPTPPTDLVVLAEAGTARLLWEGSDDDDVAGYLVFRRAAGGEFEQLTDEPIRPNEYLDNNAASGRTYAYRIVAVDDTGNTSEPSEEVEALIP